MTNSIYIFGAHSRAQTLSVYLKALEPALTVKAYLVDNDEANPSEAGGIPVLHLDASPQLDLACPVYIGTRGEYHQKVTDRLQTLGFQQIHPVTPTLDMELRNCYLAQHFRQEGRCFQKIDDRKVCIYVAKSIHDRNLQDIYQLMSWEQEIQVGAALTDKRLSPDVLTDDTSDNISEKNRQYCELTALYWIWKNAREEIVGLSHYRRHFLLPQDWMERMEERGIDVILTTPLYVTPSLAENFRKRHDAEIWDCMMEILKEQDACLFQEAERFFRGNLYSPCNMLITRKPVLDHLCSWLFPILEMVTGKIGETEDPYLNRYPGFVSERLMTFFFENNRERYKLVYADKNFLR